MPAPPTSVTNYRGASAGQQSSYQVLLYLQSCQCWLRFLAGDSSFAPIISAPAMDEKSPVLCVHTPAIILVPEFCINL